VTKNNTNITIEDLKLKQDVNNFLFSVLPGDMTINECDLLSVDILKQINNAIHIHNVNKISEDSYVANDSDNQKE